MQIRESCKKELLQQLSWVKVVDVNVLQRQRRTVDTLQSSSSLANVGHILAVSSCKGGVGKSTVAVNLACELQRRGLRVGLLDADIYGPSLPLMVQPIDHAVKKSLHNAKWIQPLECTNGLKVMSFGYVNPRSGAPGAGGKGPAVMRGPIATRVINQLVGIRYLSCPTFFLFLPFSCSYLFVIIPHRTNLCSNLHFLFHTKSLISTHTCFLSNRWVPPNGVIWTIYWWICPLGQVIYKLPSLRPCHLQVLSLLPHHMNYH